MKKYNKDDSEEYELPRPAADIYAEHGLSLAGPGIFGKWLSMPIHAKVNIDVITHYYPKMTRTDQLRANKTIANLTEQYGVIA